jgi:sigma-B regulation protein RsbU (phosphoserine phosphatase)
LLFWVLSVTVPIYAAALYMSYHATAQRLEAGAARDADELAARLAAGLDTVIRPIEGGIRTVAHQLEEVDPPRAQYALRIRGILAAWPDVYGSTIATEVHPGDANAGAHAPYYFRRGGSIAYSDLALDSYGYSSLPWYRRAADSGQPAWSAPYFDAGGGETWMVTYSSPFFRRTAAGARELAGVVTADLDLAWVRGAAARIRLPPFAAGWLASPPGERDFVAPVGGSDMKDAARIRAAAEGLLARGKTFGVLPRAPDAEAVYVAVRNLETLQWRLVLIMPRSQLFAEAREVLRRQLWLGAAGLLLLMAAISFVATGVSRPIRRLADVVGGASEGNLEFPLPAGTRRDEVGVLTEALRRLRDSLKQHVQLRAESIAAQSRLEHELQIAASIQQSMLPKAGAARLPPGIQVAAALVPARQVGGDFYDYFTLPDGRLLFVIGDVSDKGIPAALFMARVSSLIRTSGGAGRPPEQILVELNATLAAGNDACMFVTLVCGTLDPRNGQLRYASAGHEAPLMRHADGAIGALPLDNGPAIGIEAAAEYRGSEARLRPGDTLVLFTDGVSEAAAADGAQFGTERLGQLLARADGGQTGRLVRSVVDSLTDGSAGFHVEDDLTLMAITLSAAGHEWRLEPELTGAGIRRAQQWLHEILADQVDAARIGEVELIAEELLTNTARAAAGRRVRASVQCALTNHQVTLIFRDDGAPFDPLARAAPELGDDPALRSVGGLGIHLVRELADDIRYTRVDDENVLEIHLARHGAMESA